MAFSIPNEADAVVSERDAELDSVDVDILVAGFDGDGVVSGCAITSDGGTGLTVASGVVRIGGVNYTVPGNGITASAADGTYPRYDLIEVGTSGTAVETTGTAESFPGSPPVTAARVALGLIPRPIGDDTIATADILDRRVPQRFGGEATEDLVMDGHVIYGGATDGDTLQLQGNSADYKDAVDFLSPIQMFPGGATFTATAGALRGIFGNLSDTIVMDFTNWGPLGAIGMGGVVEWAQPATFLSGVTLFAHTATHRNEDGTAVNGAFNQVLGVIDVATYTGVNAAFTLLGITGMQHVPTLNVSGTGTLTVTTLTGAVFGAALNTGVTLTTRVGLQVNALGGSGGTLTNQAGVVVASLTRATNNTAVLFGTTTIPSGNWGLYQGDTRTNRLNGPLRLDTSSHLTIMERTSTPTAPTAADRVHIYSRGDKLVVQVWNTTAGAARYFTLDTQATSDQSLVFSTTAPT